MKYFIVLNLILVGGFSFAQDKPAGLSDVSKGLVAILQATKGGPSNTVVLNQIKGKCVYMNYPCNGAEVLLMDDKNQMKDTRRLVGDSTFVFKDLEKNKIYKLKVNFRKTTSKELAVNVGQEVTITLKDSDTK